MRTTLLLTTLAATLFAALPATAQDSGDLLVRLRATHLDSVNKDNTGFGLSINNKWLPELDLSWFITPNWATELVLTVPQKQTIHSTVVGADIGSFKHLPPTLLLQYHVTGLNGFRPYVGAGLNYTRLSSVGFYSNVSSLGLDLKRNSWGLALQVGVDVPVGGGWLLNADLKKVQIGTTVTQQLTQQTRVSATANAARETAGKFKVDPLLFSLGVGKRF